MFDEKSRYANLQPYPVTDSRGRTVQVVPVPDAPGEGIRGYHLLRQAQRIDHLAWQYLKDPAGFWRICEANNVMQAEVLSEKSEIAIPRRNR